MNVEPLSARQARRHEGRTVASMHWFCHTMPWNERVAFTASVERAADLFGQLAEAVEIELQRLGELTALEFEAEGLIEYCTAEAELAELRHEFIEQKPKEIALAHLAFVRSLQRSARDYRRHQLLTIEQAIARTITSERSATESPPPTPLTALRTSAPHHAPPEAPLRGHARRVLEPIGVTPN